jgi:hypothetical protein
MSDGMHFKIIPVVKQNGKSNGKKKSSKVRDKWQRQILGMPLF